MLIFGDITVDSLLWLVAIFAMFHIIYTWVLAIKNGKQASRSVFSHPDEENTPSISILIPAWNEKGTLNKCIASLGSIHYPSWECIIIAGGRDGTYNEIKKFVEGMHHFRVIEQEPGGKNHALNQGLECANNEIIVILDADSIVQPNWLKQLIAPISAGYQAVTGRSQPKRDTWVSLCEQADYLSSYDVHHSNTLQGNCSIAVCRSLINEMGGFQEQVKVGVDWDLDIRLSQMDVRKICAPQARLLTDRPATLPEFWKNEVRWRRAHLRSLFVHSKKFLNSPKTVFFNLYFYGLSLFSVLFTIVALVALPLRMFWISQLWSIFIIWVLLRRAAIVCEAIAYTGNWKWLQGIWAQSLLLYVTFVAVCVAIFTIRLNSTLFKGPRFHNT